MSEKNLPSPILICVAALVVNLLGAAFVQNFQLPLYLDTGGTIFVAMLSGYVPGIIVGFATNLLKSFAVEDEMYYCSINIFVAIYTTFMARRGRFKNFPRTILTIPPLVLATTTLTMFIEKFLYCTGVVEVVSAIEMHFPTIFLRELADKGLLVPVMFVAVKFLPPKIKDTFRGLGRKQAPLDTEMRRAVYARKCPLSSLRTKVLLILMLSAFFIAADIASISYRIFEQAAVGVQVKIANVLTEIVAGNIDPAKVDDYITRGRTAEDYAAVEKNLYAVKNSNVDVKFLRVCKFTAQGCRVVFDLNAAESLAPGTTLDLDESTRPYRDELIAGRAVPPIIHDDGHEKLLTLYKPVTDKNGRCVCHVVVDLSLGLIAEYGRAFIAKVMALFSGCFVFVFVLGLRFVENNIILPINTMDYCTRGFSYDTDSVCADNVEKLKRLKIHTGDEIENLYHALVKTTQDVMTYFEKLRRARRQVAEMDELAHTDSLTGLRNKTAYTEATARLDKKISAGGAEFCIVMVDVNYLKRVNDTYGHERGNEYLMNAAKLIVAVFGAEHVYRIGGDEFVVILDGEKVSLCKYFVTQFKAETDRKNSNAALRPWEKVSAAIGVARYEAGVDKTADEVFKRADAQMYENKLAMKAARTD